jgi:hypothetical protein
LEKKKEKERKVNYKTIACLTCLILNIHMVCWFCTT